jgi:outer membrane protein assembly factor BamB
VVSAGRLIVFHRQGNKAVVDCLAASTGASTWRYQYATDYTDDFGFDEGPRATPCIAGDFVYTFGAEGTLTCVSMTDGKRKWTVDTRETFQAPKGFFGAACSPLVEGSVVLLNVGGADGAGIVAFNKDTGAVLWKATDAAASYSSPRVAELNGQRLAFFLTRSGLVAVEPLTGKVHFDFPWRARMQASVNAATPLVIGDLVFVSTSYQTGAALVRCAAEKVETIWSGDDVLSNHYATSVYRDGYLYGYDGRQEQGPRLRCVELKTGKVRWTQENFGAGTVTLAGDTLLLLKESGEATLAPAVPDGFKAIASAQILPNGVRAYPALANGLLFARSKDTLVCADLRRGE